MPKKINLPLPGELWGNTYFDTVRIIKLYREYGEVYVRYSYKNGVNYSEADSMHYFCSFWSLINGEL